MTGDYNTGHHGQSIANSTSILKDKPKSVIRPYERILVQLFAALHALAAHLSLVFYLT